MASLTATVLSVAKVYADEPDGKGARPVISYVVMLEPSAPAGRPRHDAPLRLALSMTAGEAAAWRGLVGKMVTLGVTAAMEVG